MNIVNFFKSASFPQPFYGIYTLTTYVNIACFYSVFKYSLITCNKTLQIGAKTGVFRLFYLELRKVCNILLQIGRFRAHGR